MNTNMPAADRRQEIAARVAPFPSNPHVTEAAMNAALSRWRWGQIATLELVFTAHGAWPAMETWAHVSLRREAVERLAPMGWTLK